MEKQEHRHQPLGLRSIVAAVLVICLAIPGTAAFAAKDPTYFYALEKKRTVKLFLSGDLMVHGAQLKSAKTSTGYDFKSWFHFLQKPIAEADFALLNLETTLTNNPEAYSGFPLFKSPPQIAYDLKSVGFDAVVTANNHSLDGGLKGVLTTIEHLEKAGLMYTGTTKRDTKSKPLMLERNGLKVAVVNATYGTNGIPLPKDHPHAVNLLTQSGIEQMMLSAKAEKPDAIIAFVHWGVEYARQPNAQQKQWAQQLADLGADAVIGAHPHVVQPESWLKAKDGRQVYVNYSLGNFVSNQRWRYSDTGLALNMTISMPKGKPLSISIDHVPFWVDKENSSGIAYTVLPILTKVDTKRLSDKDRRLMAEALKDFYELYPKPQ